VSHPVFAVVGHPNKGKSSIVATLAADDSVHIGPEPGTTTHCRRYPMAVDGEELYALVDTPGFQRARRALHWMKQHETSADRHADIVRQFVDIHRDRDAFPDECELLQPIIDGAGILYVVDGSVPYGEEYEPEMEILRWTGRPSLALINPIGRADHLESWRSALGQFFRVVRVFNAVTAEFHKRVELLRAFGQLDEDWRAPLDRAVASLESDRQRKRRVAAHAVAEGLFKMLTHQVEQKRPSEADTTTAKPAIEERFRENVRHFEQQARDAVEQCYSHRRIERREEALQLLDEDLFAEKTWLLFGLRRREIMASGAMGGAATGALVDAHFGGASMLAGTLIGAGLGATVGWWTAGRLVTVKILNTPLGGKRLVAGPTKNVNFPHVVFNRARYHHYLVSHRTHATRGTLNLTANPTPLMPALDKDDRAALEGVFAQLRKRRHDPQNLERLAEVIEAVFAKDDSTTSAP
jgi:GTPase Era involved in 16S rRNA processing